MNTDKENNVFELSNVLEGTGKLNFTITMPEESTVVFYINDELVDDAVDSISEETFSLTRESSTLSPFKFTLAEKTPPICKGLSDLTLIFCPASETE